MLHNFGNVGSEENVVFNQTRTCCLYFVIILITHLFDYIMKCWREISIWQEREKYNLLHDKLNCTCIFIASYLRVVGGQTHRWWYHIKNFALLSYEANRFYFTWVCAITNNRSQKTSNVVKISVTHLVTHLVPFFCSYHMLMSSVIYYKTDG